MTSAEHILALLDRADNLIVTQRLVSAGPLTVSVGFTSAALSKSISASFIDSPRHAPDAHLVLASQRELDLSALVAAGPEQDAFAVTDDGYVLWMSGSSPRIYAADIRRGRALAWTGGELFSSWERSRPGLPCLFALMAPSPWLPVHSAAVGRGGRCLLLAGVGNSGKTTTALACALAGWTFAGDDFVAANTAVPPSILPIYATARLRPDVASRFPILASAAPLSCDGPDARHELQLPTHLPEATIAGGALAAIVLPRRRGANKPEITPARRADAIHALIMATLLPHPGWRKRITERLVALVGHVPVFFIDTGSRIEAIPEALDALNDRL